MTDEDAQRIELILSDVDGVMTDGSLTYDESGTESKAFNVRDGLGVKLWRLSGGAFGIVTGRESAVVRWRAEELGVDLVEQGVQEKLPVVKRLAEAQGVPLERVAYIGDDLPDLPVIRAVGLGVAVADAAEEVRQGADLVTRLPGGRGAVRELIERVLKASHKWEAILEGYLEHELSVNG